VVRGPVGAEGLDAIAATYGTVDRRYASRTFLETIFNHNPFGHSWHAFVTDGGRVVGHYAVIPMRAVARGVPIVAGKGEALYLDAAYRSSAVEFDGVTLPTGFALTRHLHQRALVDGVTVLANITSAEIGLIQRMEGFRALKLARPQSHFLIGADALRQLRARARALWAARGLAAAQRILLALARGLLLVTGAPRVILAAPADERSLTAMATADPAGPERWGIARDLDTLRWFRRLDRIEIAALDGHPEHFAAINKGNARELLHWSVPGDSRRAALAVMVALARASVRDHAWILSVPDGMVGPHDRGLRFALRVLGFRGRPIDQALYVKSADPFFHDSRHLVLDRMFNL
jgi:hypothetical protein